MNLDEVMDDRMHQQIRISRNQLKPAKTVDSSPLPKTLEDALRPSNRAIVICEAGTSRAMPWTDEFSMFEEFCGSPFPITPHSDTFREALSHLERE